MPDLLMLLLPHDAFHTRLSFILQQPYNFSASKRRRGLTTRLAGAELVGLPPSCCLFLWTDTEIEAVEAMSSTVLPQHCLPFLTVGHVTRPLSKSNPSGEEEGRGS